MNLSDDELMLLEPLTYLEEIVFDAAGIDNPKALDDYNSIQELIDTFDDKALAKLDGAGVLYSPRTQFRHICGAEADDAGYFKSCQKKFEAFDQAIYTYLKGRDTVERKTDLDTRISKTTDQLTAYTPLSVDPPQETLERIGVGL